MKPIGLVLPALLALAGCDNGIQGADTTAEEAAADGQLAANSSVAPTGTPTVERAAEAAEAIPAALHGRWGLVPGDCTSTRGDAKGLLTVGADTLRFYESVATVGTVAESGPTRLRATFDFEGEGMTWQRDMLLEVEDGGPTLIRREYGDGAAAEPFRYLKCEEERQP